jgi:hypothetical protein
MSTQEPIRIEVTIAAPVDQVWRAMREPAQIRHWHGWEFDGLDAEIEYIYRDHLTVSEANRTLSFEDGDTFTLHDAGEGQTLLRMVRAPRGSDPDWAAYYDDITEGWITFMHQLRFALERHPGAARRTVFLDGALGSTGDPIAALGLTAAASASPGTRYTATLAGEPVSGELWFRSDNQAGFTVDAWGNGLLILGSTPASPSKPAGAAMAVLTTYGLDDAALTTHRDRWTSWWREHYPAMPNADTPANQLTH